MLVLTLKKRILGNESNHGHKSGQNQRDRSELEISAFTEARLQLLVAVDKVRVRASRWR